MQEPRGERRRCALLRDQRGTAARQQNARIGVAPRQFGRDRQPFGRLVKRHLVAGGRYVRRDRATKHDDAVRGSVCRVPPRESLLKRYDQCIAERRKAEHCEHDQACEGERPASPRKARRQQQEPNNTNRYDKVGRDGEEAKNFGKRKKHRRAGGRVRSRPQERNTFSGADGRTPRALLARSSRLLPSGVAGLGSFIHGIKTGKFGPTLDFGDDEALHAFVLGALLGDESEEVLRDHYCPVVVADDDVTWKHRTPAAADRLLPADESEAIDRSRGSGPGTPNRQLGGKHPRLVAHDSVGDQRRYLPLGHAHGQDVTENAGRGDAHGIGHCDATFRHLFDGAACRNRLRPAFRGREILAHRHESEREGRTDDANAAGNERLRPAHPAAPDSFFQQHGGDGRGRDRPQRVVKNRTHSHTPWQNVRGRPQGGTKPRRSSRRRSQATKGIESSTIHAFPTIWPSRKSSEPKASHRNTTESTTSPTTLDATTARTNPRRTSGV